MVNSRRTIVNWINQRLLEELIQYIDTGDEIE
jgi:hypothetical protein